MSRVLVASIALVLAGCSASSVATVARLTPLSTPGVVAVTAASQVIRVMRSAPAQAQPLGQVVGISCMVDPAGPLPTRAEAVDQMREKAYRLGATVISNVSYRGTGPIAGTVCVASIQATGTAYR